MTRAVVSIFAVEGLLHVRDEVRSQDAGIICFSCCR